jgi:TetR/AcrR family tetracycline transcriptional repressor
MAVSYSCGNAPRVSSQHKLEQCSIPNQNRLNTVELSSRFCHHVHIMRLDQARIVQTALRLLDKIGFESLSMRRLADELGVHASALYWHFQNKQALIDAIAKAISIPFPIDDLPDELAWDSWLEAIARSWRQTMLSRRDGALVLTSASPQAEHFVFMERLLSRLIASGFSGADAIQGFFTVTSYTLGSVFEEQRGPRHRQPRTGGKTIKSSPLFYASVKALSDRNATFEHGLQLILNGMRADLKAETHVQGTGRLA